ncbi:hypothetical protein BH11ACT7_BH11ACT7_02730 [soil metagenome]
MVARLSATDAQTFWMSAAVPNDQFVLYVFDGVVDSVASVLERVRRRASVCHDLRLRICDDNPLRYPAWVSRAVSDAQLVVHDGRDWAACLDAVVALADQPLDPTDAAWQLHVFAPVTAVPAASGPVTVAALQISHALADGSRTAALAGWLFGRGDPVPPIVLPPRGSLLLNGVHAARSHRQMVRDMDSGVLSPPSPSRPPVLTNAVPTGERRIRTVLRDRGALAGGTVTVAVLAAVGTALAGYLRARGEDAAGLAAEVPMAFTGVRQAHNHFRNIGVGLYPDLPERMALIAAELAAGRLRGAHPAAGASRRSFEAVPAPVLRWGVSKFDPVARSQTVTGHTVVSSVNRGAADLHFGTAPVLFTAGYPALSPMMSLVHGVHGIGDTVAISVHAADSAGDIDEYIERLEHALG